MLSKGVSVPSTHHSHSVSVEVSAHETNPAVDAAIELRIRQNYMLFMEPINGNVVKADSVESGQLCLQFKIPFSLLCLKDLPSVGNYVSEKLAELPISLDLCRYLKPYIQCSAAAVANKTGFKKEFKLIFAVRSVKNDLVDKQECDRIGCSFKKC